MSDVSTITLNNNVQIPQLGFGTFQVPPRDTERVVSTALEAGYRSIDTADGRVRAIGVSNFAVEHLRRLFAETGTVPAVNQIELHPYFPQTELRALHAQHGIATEAWSPLAQGAVLSDTTITRLADRYGVTPAQLVLRWHLQLGNIVIPKSANPVRIRQNRDIFTFNLSEPDVATITALDTGRRIGPDPATFSLT
ncbi:MAG: aldo/keto reductase [Actinobacteria bacterium]|nr:aldo/keto reductase [Actinomycetota bacterium]